MEGELHSFRLASAGRKKGMKLHIVIAPLAIRYNRRWQHQGRQHSLALMLPSADSPECACSC